MDQQLKSTLADKQHTPSKNGGQDQPLKLPMLNHDCLLEIFSYLEPHDLFMADKTSKYFRYLARNQMKHIKILDVRKLSTPIYRDNRLNFRLKDYHILLKQCGNSLTTVRLCRELPKISTSKLITVLSIYCKHLRHLYLQCVKLFTVLNDPRKRKMFISIVKHLESLELVGCYLTDEFVEMIQFGFNLKIINLSYNRDLTGAFINNMINLDSLNLETCQSLTSNYFAQIIKNNKSLQYLNISGCKGLIEQNYLDLVNLTELNHLVTSGYTERAPHYLHPTLVAKISKLKKLEIFNCGYSDDDMATIFIDLAKVNQLEHLVLDGNIPSNSVLKYLKYLTTLKSFKYSVNNILFQKSFELKDLLTF